MKYYNLARYIYIYIPRTQMGPLVLIGKGLVWGGWVPSKIEVIWVPGIYIYIHILYHPILSILWYVFPLLWDHFSDAGEQPHHRWIALFFFGGVFHKKHVRKLIITIVVSKNSSPSKLRKTTSNLMERLPNQWARWLCWTSRMRHKWRLGKTPPDVGHQGGVWSRSPLQCFTP